MARQVIRSFMINFQLINEKNQHRFLRLLEDNPMQGWANTVLTRQPSYLKGLHYFGKEQAFLATEDNQIVGCYQFTTHHGFVNGKLSALGYLNSLRVKQAYRHKIRVLKAGYKHLQQQSEISPYCYTSIASDNLTARRLLEKGIKELPRYHYLGELYTLLISKRRERRHYLWQSIENQKEWLHFHNQQAKNFQLAPYISETWLTNSNLTPLGYKHNQGIQACALLWQQQSFKQVKIMHYHPALRFFRPVYNLYNYVLKKPCLPNIGQVVPQTFLSFFYTTKPEQLISLIEDALSLCQTPLLTLALSAENPHCRSIIKAFNPFVYKTSIYRVDFSDPLLWDNRSLHLEAAIL